jgi:hypothetical protein
VDFVLTAIGAAIAFTAIALLVARMETRRRMAAGERISTHGRERVREEAIVAQVESLIERERAHAKRQRAAVRETERSLAERAEP